MANGTPTEDDPARKECTTIVEETHMKEECVSEKSKHIKDMSEQEERDAVMPMGDKSAVANYQGTGKLPAYSSFSLICS